MVSGSIRLIPLLAFALMARDAAAEMWRIDPAASSVGMTYTELDTPRPSRFTAFTGRFDVTMADPAATRGALEIEVGSFDTDDAVREGVLLSAAWLDARRYPLARFAMTGLRARSPDRFVIKGLLTIRDRTRPVSFPVTLTETARTLRATGQLSIRRRDYDLADAMTESFVTIGETIELTFDLIARRDGT